MADQTMYRFEPLERRGLLLGLGAGQLVALAAGMVVAVVSVSAWPGALGLVCALVAVATGVGLCRPVHGRPPAHWARLALGFVGHGRSQVLPPPGHSASAPTWGVPRALSKTLAPGLWLTALAQTADDSAFGVLVDEQSGAAGALLRVRGDAFCMLDGPEKHQRLAAWASVLESMAGQGSNIWRSQWCQRTVPGDGEALVAHLRRTGDPAAPGFSNHLSLVERAGARAWRHEAFLFVSVRCRPRRGCPDDEGAEVLRHEVKALRALMHGVGLTCEGIMGPAALARAIGSYLVPGLSTAPTAHPWPLAFHENWSELRGDGLWHRTYWVAEWPRTGVGPDFLSPLLMGRGQRSFSVVMAPVPPEKARREAESSRTAQLADSHLRAQGGFMETAQHRREAEAVEGREAGLADGRGAFELAGYVSVCGRGAHELEGNCAEVERAAGAARLVLRPLYGQQRQALSWALPLGRGL